MFNLLSGSTDSISLFIPIIVAVLVPFTMVIGDVLHRKTVEKQNGKITGDTYKVRHNKYTLTGTVVATVFMGFLALIFPVLYVCNVPNSPTLGITVVSACCFGCFAMLCLMLLIIFKRWRITVGEEKLEFIPYFGKIRTFSWNDIEYIKRKDAANYQVYLKDCDIKIVFNTSIMVGGNKFIDDLKQHGVSFLGDELL